VAVHDSRYKLAASRLKARTQSRQNAQDTRNWKFAKPAMQAQQDQANAPYFANYAAQHPGELTGAPGVAPPRAAAPAPAAPQASPNGDVSTPGDVDPRDSTYGAGLAALLGQVQSQRQAVASADATDQQGFNENLGRIAANRAGSLDSTLTNANHQGLLYSGILGQRQGQVNGQYDDQVNSERTALTGRQSQRQAQLQQIGNLTADASSPYGYSATGGAGLDFYNLLRDAADRRTAAAASAAPGPDPTPDPGSMGAPGPTPPLNHTGPTAGGKPRTAAYKAAAVKIRQQSAQNKKNAPYFQRLAAAGQGNWNG
jgi:hypothetical protein